MLITWVNADTKSQIDNLSIVLICNRYKRLKKVAGLIKTVHKIAKPLLPEINQLLDAHKQELKGALPVNSLVIAKGSRLKFNPDDQQQGLYLQKKGSKEQIKITSIIENTNKHQLVLIPDVPSGLYKLIIKVVFLNSKKLRTVRSKSYIEII